MENEDLTTLEDLYTDYVLSRRSIELTLDRMEGKILDAMRKKKMEIDVSLVEAEKHAMKEAI